MKFTLKNSLLVLSLVSVQAFASQRSTPQGSPMQLVSPVQSPAQSPEQGDGAPAAAAAAVAQPILPELALAHVNASPDFAAAAQRVDALLEEDEAVLPMSTAQELAQLMAANPEAVAAAQAALAQAHNEQGQVFNMHDDMKADGKSPQAQ